jgi:amino acid transporter
VALVIWLVGGVLAWTGATTLAELGTAIPGEGLSFSRLLSKIIEKY